MRTSVWLSAVVALGAFGDHVVAQPPAEAAASPALAEVRLEAKDGRTQFTLGEPITLELVFTYDTQHYSVNATQYPDLEEEITVTPSEGWFRSRQPSNHDYSSVEVPPTSPLRVPILLNQGIVFQKPGHYAVSIKTERLLGQNGDFPATPLTSNTLDLDLIAPDDREEAALVRSLSAQIASAKGSQRHEAAGRLSFLGGDDAIRAKVGWLVGPNDDNGDVQVEMLDGLASSRNLQLQLDLLEAAWRDVQRVPDSLLFDAMQKKRAFQRRQTQDGWQMVMAPKTDSAARQAAEEGKQDINEILASLPQRAGTNRRDTIYFLVEDGRISPSDHPLVKPILLEEFGRMDPQDQGMLLQSRWDSVRDPALIPDLEAMLKSPAAAEEHGDALKRLIELSPQTARPWLVREICDPASSARLKEVADFPADTLPEVDACLQAQLETLKKDKNKIYLWQRAAEMAGRFGSSGMLPAMRAMFAAHKVWPTPNSEGAFLAYFLRYSTMEAMLYIRPLDTGADGPFFEIDNIFEARKATFPLVLEAWFRTRLERGTDAEAGWAAYYLSRFGRPEDKFLLERRLDRVRQQLQDRLTGIQGSAAASSGSEPGMLEVNLLEALVGSRNVWEVGGEEADSLKRGCVSAECKR